MDALCRKYATELKAYRLGKVTAKFCDEVSDALIKPKSGPTREPFDWAIVLFKRMAERGYNARRLPAVEGYLRRCLHDLRVLPQGSELLRALLPKAAARGLISRPP